MASPSLFPAGTGAWSLSWQQQLGGQGRPGQASGLACSKTWEHRISTTQEIQGLRLGLKCPLLSATSLPQWVTRGQQGNRQLAHFPSTGEDPVVGLLYGELQPHQIRLGHIPGDGQGPALSLSKGKRLEDALGSLHREKQWLRLPAGRYPRILWEGAGVWGEVRGIPAGEALHNFQGQSSIKAGHFNRGREDPMPSGESY